jgi:hypothetical protein
VKTFFGHLAEIEEQRAESGRAYREFFRVPVCMIRSKTEAVVDKKGIYITIGTNNRGRRGGDLRPFDLSLGITIWKVCKFYLAS